MSDSKKRAKRVKPLIRAKQGALDLEAVALSKIRAEKKQAMGELRRFEQLYINGVAELNRIRQTRTRDNIEIMDRQIDHYKSRWYDCMRKMREIEMQERAQLNQLFIADKELKSMEKLEERYLSQLVQEEMRFAQKEMDEAAQRNFTNRRRAS